MKYLILITILLIGCADNKVIGGKEYVTYGLFNANEFKDPCIRYSLSKGNVVWGIVLFETVLVPVYMVGFSLWEPVEMIEPCSMGGVK